MIAIQACALIALLIVIQITFQIFKSNIPAWALVLAQASFAALITIALKKPKWWIWIALITPPIFALLYLAQIPIWIFPVIVILLAGFFWNAGGEQVPLYLSNPTTWRALAEQLNEKQNGQFADLGCGFGGALFYLSKQYPNWTFVGVETAPFSYLVCKMRQTLSPRSNLSIHYSSLWDQDFSHFDIIYVFLSPAPMDRLLKQAKKEMKPDSLLISNSFTSQIYPHQEILPLQDQRQTELFFWRFTKK